MRLVVLFVPLTLGISLAAVPALAQQTDTVRQAQALHEQGAQLYQQGRYREAAQAFEQSERLLRNPLNHWNLMRSYEELHEYRSALRWADQYLANPDLSASDRAEAEQHRQQIQAAQGSGPSTPDSSPGGSSLVGPWAVLGSGLALLLTGGVLDVVAYTRSGSDHSSENLFASFTEYDDWRSGVRNLALAGDVLVGVGAATAVAGLVWLLLARRRSPAQASEPRFFTVASRDGLMWQARLRF